MLFKQSKKGIYYHDVKNREILLLNEESDEGLPPPSPVSTIAQNLEGFTKQQYEQAKMVRRIYAMVVRPSPWYFEGAIASNQIKNC